MAKVTQEMLVEAGKALAEMQKLINKQDKLIRSSKNLNKQSKKTQSTMEGMATSLVTRFASVGSAILAVRSAIQSMDAAAKGASGNIVGQSDSRKRLAQLSGDLQGNLKLARELSIILAKPLSVAQDFTFEGLSAGLSPKELKSVAATSKFTPDALKSIGAILRVQTQFRGKGGTPAEIINQFLAASEFSPVSSEGIASLVSKVAPAVAQQGGTLEEALALVGFAARGDDPDRSATMLRALFTELSYKRGFEGIGAFAALHKIEGLFVRDGVVDDVGLGAFFSNIRAKSGANIAVPNIRALEKSLTSIIAARAETGTSSDRTAIARRQAEGDPGLAAARALDTATAAGQLGTELGGIREALTNSQTNFAKKEIDRLHEEDRFGPISTFLNKLAINAIDLADLSPKNTARALGLLLDPPDFLRPPIDFLFPSTARSGEQIADVLTDQAIPQEASYQDAKARHEETVKQRDELMRLQRERQRDQFEVSIDNHGN